METIPGRMKASFVIAVLVLAGAMSAIAAVVISPPALAFLASTVG